eukprot:gene10883-12679_t
MQCAYYPAQGQDLVIGTKPIPVPQKGWVRIKVIASGVCHSDIMGKHGYPGIEYPRIPGHEVAGVIDLVGEGVTKFALNDKVGVGWFGGHCATCDACQENKWISCEKGLVCGIHYDGGYAEYMVAPEDAVARIPEGLDFALAAPLMCAGITTFNSIRNMNIKAGSIVAVQGVGGLGHLAIQFAKKMGFEVVAVSSGADKEPLARQLGASHYIDASNDAGYDQLKALKPKLIVVTGPNAQAAEKLSNTLTLGAKLLLLGAIMEPIKISPIQLLMNCASIVGWASGDSRDTEDTLKFSYNNQVETMIEKFPITKAQEAVDRMLSNKVRFRACITFDQ